MKQLNKRWEIHFIPLCHHDYGYTTPAEPLLGDYMQYYRDVLRFIEITDSYPDEAKFRYTCEQVWSVWHFLENCTEDEKESFIRHAKDGRIEVSAFLGNIAEAHCSNEEIIRMMYPAFELKRKFGIPIYGGSFVDITGQGWGLPKVMAGAGLEYFFNGMPSYFMWDEVCGVHGAQVVHSYWDEEKVMRHGKPDAYMWEAQDGSKILTYYQGSYGWFHGWLATGPEALEPESFEDVEDYLPAVLEDMEKRGVPFDTLRFIDHGLDNCAPQMKICDIVKLWNEKYDNPKLRVSTNAEFFRRFRKNCGELPVYRGEIPHTEFTSATMSFAKETGLNFRNHNATAAAEILSAAASLCGMDSPPQSEVSEIYRDMLMFDEHCYGMADPLGSDYDYNWSTKAHHAYRAAANAQRISKEAFAAITGNVKAGGPHITVFNPLSFPRNDVVKIASLPINPEDYELIDCDCGEPVPHTVYTVNRHDLADEMSAELETFSRMGEPEISFARNLIFVAKNVPSIGWKTYKLVPKDFRAAAEKQSGCVLENSFYRIEFDKQSGRLLSLFDKEENREMTDSASKHPFAGVICRDCHTQEEFLPEYNGFEIIHSDAVMQKALIKFHVKGIPEAALGVTLYSGIKRVDFEIKLLFSGLPIHEWFLALPLNIDKPKFEYEGAQCRPTPFRDQFPGSNTNYYCVQSWASGENDDVKAVLSSVEAHSVSFGSMWPSYVSQAHHAVHPVDFGKPYIVENEIQKGHMYILLAYNNIRTNFKMAQNSLVRYTFSLTTGDLELSPTRFGWGFQSKLAAAYSSSGGELMPSRSLLRVDAENVRILTLKRAEDGDGFIIRLMETEGKAVDATVLLPQGEIKYVAFTNIVEEDFEAAQFSGDSFTVGFKPFEVKTFRILNGGDKEKCKCREKYS